MNKLFENMYKLLEEEENIKVEDDILEAAIDNIKDSAILDSLVNEGTIKEIRRSIKKINYDEMIGTVILSGVSDKVQEQQNKVVEIRVVGKYTYYMYIVINIRKEESITDEDIKDIILSNAIDMDSRMIDYYLDIICMEKSKVGFLNKRDETSEDPLIILAKALLLVNSDDGRAIFNQSNFENENILFHIMDQFITPNLRTDWLISNTIKSADKANTFSAQILLKQEMYKFCLDMRVDDKQKQKQIYMDLFTKGKAYKIENYDYIKKFVAYGTQPFSTEQISIYWNTLI